MMVYIFTPEKRVRRIIPTSGVTDLVHDEAANTLYATVGMEYGVINGEHLGFMCVDGHFRLFTVTKAENFDDNHTTIITAQDAIVRELMETVVENLQQLDVQLIPAIEGLLAASGTQDAWTVTGAQPDRTEKSRAYYTDMWTMLETYKALYEWQIIPYYTFSGGAISGRVIELKADVAEFRGRILTSKKDASNVYVIKTDPPITRMYVLGPAEGTEDEPKNMYIRDVAWSISSGDPAEKPKGQAWIEDAAAVGKYGVHTAVVQINDAEDEEDLIEKGWKHLQTIKEPRSTVEATIQDLEQVKGYANQVIRLGDLVPIRLSTAQMEAARVINIKRDYIRPSLTKIIIGDKEATIQSQVSTLMTNAAHTFERLTIYKNRFHEDEALIQLNAEMIQMNAEVIEANAKEIRANAEKIDLKAGLEEVTELGNRISAAEILIDGINAEIDLKASRAELSEVESRLSSAEARIDGAEAAIALKAEQSTVTAMEQRLSQAEILIDGANAQISLKASQSTVNALGERISNAEIKIDGAQSSITLLAEEIRLAGYVTAEELDAAVSDVETAYATYIMTNEIDAGTGEFGTLIVSGSAAIPHGSFGSIEIGGETAATQEWVESQGYIKELPESDYITEADLTSHLEAYATRDWVTGTATRGFATEAWVKNQGYLTSVPSGYATTTWVNTQLSGLSSVYATRDWVTGTAIKGLATETWVTSQGYLKSVPSTYATQYWVTNQGYAKSSDLSAYATRDWVTGTATAGFATEAWVRENFSKASATYQPTEIERYGSVSGTSIPVRALNASGAVLLTGTVDAGDVYTSGSNAGYAAGYADATPTSVGIGDMSYSAGANEYNFGVYVFLADGTYKQFTAPSLNAGAAYDAGYDAGYAAGVAAGGKSSIEIANTSVGSDNILTVYAFDSDTGRILATKTIDVTSTYNRGFEDAKDAVELRKSAMKIINTQPNYMYAETSASVYINDEYITSISITGSQYFPGLGQG